MPRAGDQSRLRFFWDLDGSLKVTPAMKHRLGETGRTEHEQAGSDGLQTSPQKPFTEKNLDTMRTSHIIRSVKLNLKLRAWQKRKQLTNEQAAKQIGVPLRTYGDWRGGQHAPRGFARTKLLELLK